MAWPSISNSKAADIDTAMRIRMLDGNHRREAGRRPALTADELVSDAMDIHHFNAGVFTNGTP